VKQRFSFAPLFRFLFVDDATVLIVGKRQHKSLHNGFTLWKIFIEGIYFRSANPENAFTCSFCSPARLTHELLISFVT
jgi:hypothetical protein